MKTAAFTILTLLLTASVTQADGRDWNAYYDSLDNDIRIRAIEAKQRERERKEREAVRRAYENCILDIVNGKRTKPCVR